MTYYYPDGTASRTKPRPYDTFTDRDGVVWIWDDADERWEMLHNQASFPLFDFDEPAKEKRVNKCTCGSASVGSQYHSTWCDLDKPMDGGDDGGDWFGL
jgi:hypothetical protein